MSCYRDLNSGPLPYQGSALPLSYNSNIAGAQAQSGCKGRHYFFNTKTFADFFYFAACFSLYFCSCLSKAANVSCIASSKVLQTLSA